MRDPTTALTARQSSATKLDALVAGDPLSGRAPTAGARLAAATQGRPRRGAAAAPRSRPSMLLTVDDAHRERAARAAALPAVAVAAQDAPQVPGSTISPAPAQVPVPTSPGF